MKLELQRQQNYSTVTLLDIPARSISVFPDSLTLSSHQCHSLKKTTSRITSMVDFRYYRLTEISKKRYDNIILHEQSNLCWTGTKNGYCPNLGQYFEADGGFTPGSWASNKIASLSLCEPEHASLLNAKIFCPILRSSPSALDVLLKIYFHPSHRRSPRPSVKRLTKNSFAGRASLGHTTTIIV